MAQTYMQPRLSARGPCRGGRTCGAAMGVCTMCGTLTSWREEEMIPA